MTILNAACLMLLATAITAIAGEHPYDEQADAKLELKQALTQAAADKVAVIVVFGANWCPDCQMLDLAMKRGATAKLLSQHFKLVKVNLGKPDRTPGIIPGIYEKNVDIAAAYGVPLAKGIPTVVILSAKNAVLYITHEGELANARHMGDQGIYDFFKRVTDSAVARK